MKEGYDPRARDTAHMVKFKPKEIKPPVATDLQLWVLANLHLIRWRTITLPNIGPTNIPSVGRRDVHSTVTTMRKRRWIAYAGTGSRAMILTIEGRRVLEASRLDPWRLVWC